MQFIQVLNKGMDSRLKMPSETFPGNLQPAIFNPSFVQHWSNFFPVLKSQRFRVLHGHQGDLPLGGKVESSYAVFLMVRGHIPHMYAPCCKNSSLLSDG